MDRRERTQRLDVVLIKTPLHVFDHEASLPDLRVPNHSHLDDDAGTKMSVCPVMARRNGRTYSSRLHSPVVDGFDHWDRRLLRMGLRRMTTLKRHDPKNSLKRKSDWDWPGEGVSGYVGGGCQATTTRPEPAQGKK